MGLFGARTNLLRHRKAGESERVTFIELFFDLVFVFAITQVSHGLLHNLTALGALEMGLVFTAVWWVWIYTSWVTNWVDPDRTPVRIMLIVLMLAGLVLSSSIPDAFDKRGLSFAAAFATMQIGRSLFMLWATRRHAPGNHRNFQRITAWLAVSGTLWIAGGLAHDGARLGLWAAALSIELVGPAMGFHTLGLGRSSTADWDVEGEHLAERCALFIIIALGESILMTGATFAGLDWTLEIVAAFATAFVGSVAMWWLYFHIGARRGSEVIHHSDDPASLARMGYTYLHLPIVAGIVVCAMADELVLRHPHGHVSLSTAVVMIGGPALYLVGNLLFKRVTAPDVTPGSHLLGLGFLGLLAFAVPFVTPLVLAAATSTALVLVCGLEAAFTAARSRALKAQG